MKYHVVGNFKVLQKTFFCITENKKNMSRLCISILTTLSLQWIMPFTLMLVFIPNVVVAYVVAVSSGLSVAASLLLPW